MHSDSIIKACQASWEESSVPGTPNKNNCSGFLRSVAQHLGIEVSGMTADGMQDYMDKFWVKVSVSDGLGNLAAQGRLVVASLKGSEHTPPAAHGHVAVIVPSSLLYKGKYPYCWCGSLSTARSQGEKSVGQVWNRTDRDRLHYFRAP